MCAGDKDRWGGGLLFEDLQFEEAFDRIRRVRDRRLSKKDKKKERKEKEERGEMGLQLLFGGGLLKLPHKINEGCCLCLNYLVK